MTTFSSSSYQTLQRISPPTPKRRQVFPVKTPLGVERMVRPSPSRTLGISSFPH